MRQVAGGGVSVFRLSGRPCGAEAESFWGLGFGGVGVWGDHFSQAGRKCELPSAFPLN